MPATPPAEDDAGSSGAETPNAQHLLAKRPPEGPRGGPSSSLPPDSGKLRVITPHGINPRNAIPEAEKVGWLPSGTIIPGILLTGIDASTLAGQNLPYPVLIRLSDTALLPNDFRMDLQNCVAVGAAVGDLATERVSIRTESLSCLLKRSGALVTIDGDLKATILGGDGKTGIRGRVVMKEGALIARTMVAGFLSGLSEAFKPRISYAPIQLGSSDVTNNSAFSLPPIQDTLAAAGLAGIGKSMDRLTEFYTALAMKTAPVIEVSSGTKVDLVVLKGLPLRWKASAPSEQRSDLIE
jgi:conjugal transfer pilus assembly protein TraB